MGVDEITSGELNDPLSTFKDRKAARLDGMNSELLKFDGILLSLNIAFVKRMLKIMPHP